jgi:hypothetical protein
MADTPSGPSVLPDRSYRPDDDASSTSDATESGEPPAGGAENDWDFSGGAAAGEQPAADSASPHLPVAAIHEPATDVRLRVVFMGPSNSGKTNLIAAIDQAAHTKSPRSPGPLLEVVPGEGFSSPIEEAIETILTERARIHATTQPWSLSFWMGTVLGDEEYSADVNVRDAQGGALFPPAGTPENPRLLPIEDLMVSECLEADVIVLCLDPTDKASLAACHRRLPKVLSNITATVTGVAKPPTTWERVLDRLGIRVHKPKRARARRRLHAMRFLLCFTKTDALVNQQNHRKKDDQWQIHKEPPALLAQGIDCVRQACELVGEGVINRILSALPPGGEFGVAFTSAWGFDPSSGQPFMETAGTDPVVVRDEDRVHRLRNWTPFGVREAMIFALTGRAFGPVSLVTRSMVDPELRARKKPVQTGWPWFKRRVH